MKSILSFCSFSDKSQALRSDITRVLYESLPYSVLMNFAGVAIIVFIQWNVITPALIVVWAVLLVLISLFRYRNYRRYLRRSDQGSATVAWLYRNYIGVIASGMVWGSAAFLLYPENDIPHQLVIILMLTGIAAGAMTTLSVCRNLIVVYLVLMLGPLTLKLYAQGNEHGFVIGTMVTLYLLTIIVTALKYNRNITELFRLNHEMELAQAELKLAAAAFEGKEGIFITDSDGLIKKANHTVTEITGYAEAELLDQTPRIFKSGLHDTAFYAAMWRAVTEHGSWSGEIWNRRKNGEIYPQRLTITAVKDDANKMVYYVGHFNDISDQKAREQRMSRQAHYDQLTELMNRHMFIERLNQEINRLERSGARGLLLYIDLDKFKPVNDEYGHHVGDALLKSVAGRLRESLRTEDNAARIGGDEFAVLMTDIDVTSESSAAIAQGLIERIISHIAEEHLIGEYRISCALSVGAVMFPCPGCTPDVLLRRADGAMYRAKKSGHNKYVLYDTGDAQTR